MPWASAPDLRFAAPPIVLFGVILGFATPAASQDARDDLAGKTQALQAEAGEYLKKHPVKQSSLFESTFIMIGTFGEVRMMSVDTCEYEPFPRDWVEAPGALRENSRTMLSMAFLNGENKQSASMLAGQAVTDRSLCAELKRHYSETLREPTKPGPALRKAEN